MSVKKDNKLLEFDPHYPFILPQNWKDKNSPSVYEIQATSNTLKRMYSEKVKEIQSGAETVELGEKKLIQIASNYQSVKALLFQSR